MATTQIDGSRQIKSASIADAQIASGAAIASSKLADGANFTKKDGSVAFTADQSMGGNKLTNVGTPTSANDGTNKAYVDAIAQGYVGKTDVRVASTANVTVSNPGTAVFDGVTLSNGDTILLKDQSTASQNGIYVFNGSGSALTRATAFDTSAEVKPGLFVFVSEGTTNADNGWALTTDAPITLGTTSLTFTQTSGAGQITAGAGLTKTGNTLDVQVDASSIEINSDTLRVKALGITNAMLLGSIAASKLVGSDIATVGTITTGVWNGTAVDVAHGGTGLTSTTANGVLLGGTTTTGNLQNAGTGTSSGQVLTSNGSGTAPTWQSPAASPTFITRETPSGSVNGSNTSFVLANTPTSGSESVFLNGILQEPGAGNDYTISGATITYLAAPLSGDKIRVSYRF